MKLLADNRSARFKYEILETTEAGLALQGWEVKSIRAGRVQIGDAHAALSRGEFFLLNAHISPLLSASSHIAPDPTRSRKLLLHAREIERLIGKTREKGMALVPREKGMALVPLNLHLTRGKVKVDLALARGKKTVDKRRAIEEREWKRQQGRILRGKN